MTTGSYSGFIEQYCQIRGRYGDKVYRRKRNGKPWVYDYEYKAKYQPTVLSRRTNCVVETACRLSNPRRKGYGEILNKLYYYTPYFVYAGSYSFTCNTFLKLRRARDYILEINGVMMEMHLCPRTKLKLIFEAGKTYTVRCYVGEFLYSEREIVVIEAEQELEEVYRDWYEEHLAEILSLPDPRYRSMRIYRRGIEPPAWLQYLVGKTEQGILYRSCYRERMMYVRQSYEHQHNETSDYYYSVQKRITECWNKASPEFKEVWEKYHIRWFDANYRKNWKRVQQHNLFSKMVFLAAGILGFDLEEISPENWLWGVETLGDLIEVCGMRNYGLRIWERNTRIMNFEC